MCATSPPRMREFIALILPAFIPMPARCDTYLPIAISDAKILSSVSSESTRTHDANCLIGVRTPAITGVGILILNNDIAS